MTNTWRTTDGVVDSDDRGGEVIPIVARLARAWPAAGIEPDRATESRDDGLRRLYERRHADMVRFAVFLTGDADQGEDIAHEAFVRVYDAWDRIDAERIDAYLRATVVNIVRSRHRHDRVVERTPLALVETVVSAEDDALRRVGRERVLAAVAALPLRQRACVVMRHWMRMTESEIADTLELSVGSVRTHLHRGTETLKTTLGGTR